MTKYLGGVKTPPKLILRLYVYIFVNFKFIESYSIADTNTNVL